MRLQVLDESVNFSCGSCTKCCDQPWHTLIEKDKAHALEGHDFSAYPQLAGQSFYHATKGAPEGTYMVAKGEGTKCLFLDTDGLCIIHKEMGPEAKPHACLKFPYMVSRTAVDDRVSVDFGCPAAQDSRGMPLGEQVDDIVDVIRLPEKPANPNARIPLDANLTLSLAEAEAFFARMARVFNGGFPGDVWTRFAETLTLLWSLQKYRSAHPSNGDDETLVNLLRTDARLPDMPETPAITAYANPRTAPSPTRLLFAATLYRDTCPAGAGLPMGLWKRLTLLPKLMSLAKLSGAYPSRLLGRNVAITEVMAHKVDTALAPEATELLLRYYRSRIWQRRLMGTRMSIIAGVHQHIQDFNAILFFARAEAQRRGEKLLSEELIRLGMNRVEFHLANQSRLFDQNNKVAWIDAQLQSPTVALQSLRLMATQPAPAKEATTADGGTQSAS